MISPARNGLDNTIADRADLCETFPRRRLLTSIDRPSSLRIDPNIELMAFNPDLPLDLKSAGWKVKIRDKERLEEPHIANLKEPESSWRLSLLSKEFLHPGGNWREIDGGVRHAGEHNWMSLIKEWNRTYPGNPDRWCRLRCSRPIPLGYSWRLSPI